MKVTCNVDCGSQPICYRKMSGDRRTLLWRFVVCCLLLSFALVAQNFPSVGGQAYYWNNRYSLGYTDWPGFWNNANTGQYNRAHSEFRRQCSGCSCNDQTRTATCAGPTTA